MNGLGLFNSCFLVPLIGGIGTIYIANNWGIMVYTYHLLSEPETAIDLLGMNG